MIVLHHIILGILCLGQLAHGSMFKTSFGIKGFRQMMNHRQGYKHINGISTFAAAGDVDPKTGYKAYTIAVPIDHFHNDSQYEPHTNNTFELRYWFDRSNYKEGAGPVIVLQGGETKGDDRLVYLQKGIIAQLTKATHGLGVVLEHRYYGESIPNLHFSRDNLRFLTTEQALADMAYFAQNVVFEGLEHLDLTAPNTAYFAYGGSYAGAFVALLRKIYPDVYWGAIASSAVTNATVEYWHYFDAIRTYGPSDCLDVTSRFTQLIDNLLLGKVDNSPDLPKRLKNVFGLGNVTHDNDFAFTVSWGVRYFEMFNWDPAEGSLEFDYYCANVTTPTLLYPDLASRKTEVQYLMNSAGYGDERDTPFTNQLLNYIGYVTVTEIQSVCQNGPDQDSCFGNHNGTFYQQDDSSQIWRPWKYQTCTEWGFFQTGTLADQNQPPLISQLVDLNFATIVCREAFGITTLPNVERINRYGGYNFSYPRLAFVDGEKDVWRGVTPHAPGLAPRKSTKSEPFLLIDGGFHHWDENGVFPNDTRPNFPPKPVTDTKKAEVVAVKSWFDQWKKEKRGHCGSVGMHCPGH